MGLRPAIVMVASAALLLAGCPSPTNEEAPSDADLITAVMEREIQAHIDEDPDLLREVFAEDPIAVWYRGTTDTSDDQTFNGQDAIVDAYVNGWNNWRDVQYDLTLSSLSVDGDTATVEKTGTGTRVRESDGAQVAWNTDVPETWQFERTDNGWRVVNAEWKRELDVVTRIVLHGEA